MFLLFSIIGIWFIPYSIHFGINHYMTDITKVCAVIALSIFTLVPDSEEFLVIYYDYEILVEETDNTILYKKMCDVQYFRTTKYSDIMFTLPMLRGYASPQEVVTVDGRDCKYVKDILIYTGD